MPNDLYWKSLISNVLRFLREQGKVLGSNEIIKGFLNDSILSEPLEYLKAICFAGSPNFPVYYLLVQANERIPDAISRIEEITARGLAKKLLLERLRGKTIPQSIISSKITKASMKKNQFRKMWIDETIIVDEEGLKYCLDALSSLERDEIIKHKEYIKSKLLDLYEKYFEKVQSVVAYNMRKTICRIDEVLYLEIAHSF